MKRARSVSAKDFVLAWRRSTSRDQVARQLGLKPSTVGVRAARYRRAGVRLKDMPRRGRPRLDVAALNRLPSRSAAS